MLFLAMSTPRPERPTEMRDRQARFWDWMRALEDAGTVKQCYVKVGRGAVAVFDVDSHETLHRLLNEWADHVPAEFTIVPLVDRAFQERRARGQ
jgi:muconolactone delta-isomerase